MKQCKKCKEIKSLEEFYKDKGNKTGFQSHCKLCNKAANRARYAVDPLARKAKSKAYGPAYRKLNSKKCSFLSKKWREANPDKAQAGWANRRARKLNATPRWLTKKHFREIQEFYTLAKEFQWLSEDKLEVDHIVPLQGKNVCGLHVPWNLQILPSSLNRAKKNKLLS